MKRFKIFTFSLLFLTLLMTACGGPKKCGGGRGTRVEMGKM